MMDKDGARESYQVAGTLVYKEHVDAIKQLRERGVDTRVVVTSPQIADGLRRYVKRSETPKEALRPAMKDVARRIRTWGMHELEAVIEFQRSLVTLQMIANTKYREKAVSKIANDISMSAPDLLGLDIDFRDLDR